MKKRILVAYATTHGSTREIAEEIAAVLEQNEAPVDILPAGKVRSVNAYSGVILGAPQYMFHWHKEALRFISRFEKDLKTQIPIAVFAGGPIEKGSDEENETIRVRLHQELAKYPWLNPASILFVGGKFNPDKLRFPYNLIPALKNLPAVDYRDWPEIRTWAKSMPGILQRRETKETK